MKRVLLLAIVLCGFAAVATAQRALPTVYVAPSGDGFEVYLAAAMHKKQVPITVVNKADGATYTLTAAQVEVEKVTAGSKLVKCLFAYCAGSEDKASTSVQLTDGSGAVKWSYAVNKGRGAKNRQAMAEAVAKHLKDEFLSK